MPVDYGGEELSMNELNSNDHLLYLNLLSYKYLLLRIDFCRKMARKAGRMARLVPKGRRKGRGRGAATWTDHQHGRHLRLPGIFPETRGRLTHFFPELYCSLLYK